MKHQIILLGKDTSSVYHGIKEFEPDFVHLLITEQTEKIFEPMLSLLPSNIEYKSYKVDPYDGYKVIETCELIHQSHQGHFNYNLSEGTKIMAFAAYQVAKKNNANCFYFSQLGDLIDMHTFKVSSAHKILKNQEILHLSGNDLTEYNNVKDLSLNDIKTAHVMKNFMEQHNDINRMIQQFYTRHCHRNLKLLPMEEKLPKNIRFYIRNGGLFIAQHSRVLLNIKRRNACHLYFEGRWWETLVTEQVLLWGKKQKENPQIWQNVILKNKETQNDHIKNEIDILLNNKNNLVFIECKSGHVSQSDIYKIDAVRETYGGDISIAALASYYPIPTDLRNKCKDLHIHVFAPEDNLTISKHIEKMPNWLDRITKEMEL